MKPYSRLQLVQAFTDNGKKKGMEFCEMTLEMMEDATFVSRLISTDGVYISLERHNQSSQYAHLGKNLSMKEILLKLISSVQCQKNKFYGVPFN